MKRTKKPGGRYDGPLLLEHNGPEEGWAVVTDTGQIINGRILSAPCLAYYLRQHQLAGRITNLDALESRQLMEIARNKTVKHESVIS